MHFNYLVLWLFEKEIRKINFEPNKVNVITGGSNKGKTDIFNIIDYCLLSSKKTISDSVVNENTEWYGINFTINDKTFTIARRRFENGKESKEYYFSSIGETPENSPNANINEDALRKIIETEFSITNQVKVPYGGKFFSLGSKISFRYFLMFNIISQDTITSSKTFFDHKSNLRYIEALQRIFNLATGVDTLNNIILRERKEKIAGELHKEQLRLDRFEKKKTKYSDEILEVVEKARAYGIIQADIKDASKAIDVLKDSVDKMHATLVADDVSDYESIQRDIYKLNLQLRRLKRIQNEYAEYKKTLASIEDSLRPIEFLREKEDSLIKTSVFDDVFGVFEQDLQKIKNVLKKKAPMDLKISDLIRKREKQIGEKKSELLEFPKELKNLKNDTAKFIFLGEVKAKLEIFSDDSTYTSTLNKERLERDIASIEIEDISEKFNLFKAALEEAIKKYMDETPEVLDNYKDYIPYFDFPQKCLRLRKPGADYVEDIGSSSNHMFLHLYLFLGLHEKIHERKVKFIPSYLLIDQPSRPYWSSTDEDFKEQGDELKIKAAFRLLDTFIKDMNTKRIDFQMIVTEHVPPDTWQGLENVHLAADFHKDALIPLAYVEKVRKMKNTAIFPSTQDKEQGEFLLE